MTRRRKFLSLSLTAKPEAHPSKGSDRSGTGAVRPTDGSRLLPWKRIALASILASASAVALGAQANDEDSDTEQLQFRWAFSGGGASEWGQCTEFGSIPPDWIRTEIWEDGFMLELDLPEGTKVPCLRSKLPDAHRIEVFGELTDGPDHTVFPSHEGRWMLFASFDGAAAMELGEIGLAPGPDGSLGVVWDEGWEEHAPALSYLTLTVAEADGQGQDHEDKGGKGDEK